MANPFKEAEKAKKKAPGNKQEAAEKKEEIRVTEDTAEEKVQPEASVEAVEEKKENKPAGRGEEKPQTKKTEKGTKEKDIFANLAPAKPTGKTTAFYLSEENITKLKKMADKKGISVSKLLDHILSEVL